MSRRPPRNPGSANEAPPLERLWTVNQVSGVWQVSSRTVRRMIADGRLRAVRFGRAVRIPANVAEAGAGPRTVERRLGNRPRIARAVNRND